MVSVREVENGVMEELSQGGLPLFNVLTTTLYAFLLSLDLR